MIKLRILFVLISIIFIYSCKDEKCNKDYSQIYNQNDIVFLIKDSSKVEQVISWITNPNNLLSKCKVDMDNKHMWNVIRPKFILSDTIEFEAWNCLKIGENANPERQKLMEKAIKNGVREFLKAENKLYTQLPLIISQDFNVYKTSSENIKHELDSIVKTFDCSKLKERKYFIIDSDPNKFDDTTFRNIINESEIDQITKETNLSKKEVNVATTLDQVEIALTNNQDNWYLYYIKARLLCIQKQEDYENKAVDVIATAARYALNSGNSKDSLRSRIINRKSQEFSTLFEKETIFNAKLSGTMAGLETKNVEIVNVPLYFLTDLPIEGFTKSVPMVHFEKGQNVKTYVSKGLIQEIIIQIKDFNESNGVVKFDIIDRKTKNTYSENILNIGEGKQINLGSNSFPVYIRNLSDLKKPFISLSIEQGNNIGLIHSSEGPEETVRSFLTLLSERKFKSAYLLSDNQLWVKNGGLQWFSSKSAYGGINSIEINEIVTKSLDNDEAIVMAYYYAEDQIHDSRDWKQNFYLLKKNNGWKILHVKLDSL